ncbi:hypothetical protein AB0E62_30450 [Streptomyces sp. NPDC038707]|uniref:hypothetical protein n=1 Tax=Streptomyces sp. NPDC038707 TaxID=3154329 RepID=UPI0033C8381B
MARGSPVSGLGSASGHFLVIGCRDDDRLVYEAALSDTLCDKAGKGASFCPRAGTVAPATP